MGNLQEYDIVKTVEAVGDVPAESIGTVLCVLDMDAKVYLVEFIDERGKSLHVLEVDGNLLVRSPDEQTD